MDLPVLQVSSATIGRALLLFMHLLTQLLLMTLGLILVPPSHLLGQVLAPMVSPSAVWYTGYIFVRSGDVTLNDGSLRDFGLAGNGWSRVATVYGAGTWDTRAYYLYFITSDVNSSGNYVRWVGLPVRCLVY